MRHNKFLISFGLVLGSALVACAPNGVAQSQMAIAPEKTIPKNHSLAIVGYNYTDRYIDSFFVNGQGGGNLGVSWPGSSGQSATCCVNWRDGSTLPKRITVLWVAAYCMQVLHGKEGETQTMRQPLWKTADVYLNGPVPATPRKLEVHFYRDDRIELAITDGDSPARVNLPATENRYTRPGIVINDPPCPKDYDRTFASNKATKVNVTGATQP